MERCVSGRERQTEAEREREEEKKTKRGTDSDKLCLISVVLQYNFEERP